MNFQPVTSKHARSNKDVRGRTKRDFSQNRFVVKRELNQKRVFDDRLTGGKEKPHSADEARVQKASHIFGKFEIAIEASVNDAAESLA